MNLRQHTIGLIILCSVLCGSSSKHKSQNRHRPKMEGKFFGSIAEDTYVVEIHPPLVAIDKDAPRVPGLICEYRLHNLPENNGEEIPFMVNVVDRRTGDGEIVLKPNWDFLDCENQTEYSYLISAHDCGVGQTSEGNYKSQRSSMKSKIVIAVKDVNEYEPQFSTSNYSLVTEGDIPGGQPLINVEALDKDCSPKFSDICHYELIGEHANLFSISKNGVLHTQQVIGATSSPKLVEVSVVAYDCGGRKSVVPSTISILIKPVCEAQWTGFEKRVEVSPNVAGVVPLIINPTLTTCLPQSDVISIEVTVSMDINDVEKITGCDRNTYLLHEESNLCDESDRKLIELLPSTTLSEEDTIQPNINNGVQPVIKAIENNSEKIYEFDGATQAVLVTNTQLLESLNDLNLSSTFSISFKMFLDPTSNMTGNRKATVLCKSDSAGLSRHIAEHCRVMVLLRQEDGSRGVLKPAEWHWKLTNKNGCKGIWYEILINVDFPNVTLIVNGEQLIPYLIADDYPLHSIPHPPQWVIGAAYEGRTSSVTQFFHGKLSNIMIYVGRMENTQVFMCANRCKEGIKSNEKGQREFERGSTFTVAANTEDGIISKIKSLVYFNEEHFPKPGERKMNIETSLSCFHNTSMCPTIPTFQMYVMVLPMEDPVITITGYGSIARAGSDLLKTATGVLLFKEITVMTKVSNNPQITDMPIEQNLDRCEIKQTRKDEGFGKFKVRARHLMRKRKMYLEKLSDGIAIRGAQSLAVYEQVLRGIIYRNERALFCKEITFTLACSGLGGRFHSNVYHLTLTVLHTNLRLTPYHEPTSSTNTVLLKQDMPILPAALVATDTKDVGTLESEDSDGKTSVTTLVLAIGGCLVLVGLLIVPAMLHTQLSGSKPIDADNDHEVASLDEIGKEINDGDLDWDDSAMTITVNPLEDENNQQLSEDDFSELEEDVVMVGMTTSKKENPRRNAEDFYEWDN
ncbi:calsyntenin-1-like isoform X2 [Ciona intestinalis]